MLTTLLIYYKYQDCCLQIVDLIHMPGAYSYPINIAIFELFFRHLSLCDLTHCIEQQSTKQLIDNITFHIYFPLFPVRFYQILQYR